MTYRLTPFPMTLSDLQGHLPFVSFFFKCDYWYSRAAANKTAIDIERYAVLM